MIKKYNRFSEYRPGSIRPRGHLKEFLERQAKGLTGNWKRMGYPFDTTLWKAKIADQHFTEGVHHGSDEPVPDKSGVWWPYEQTGYLLDGMLRLSFLVDAPALRAEYERNLRSLLRHAEKNGHLGGNLHSTGSEWPMAVFFKSVIAYIDAFGADDVVEAFHRHYVSLAEARKGWWGRDLLNLEGVLKIYERTGDRKLLDDMVELYPFTFDYKRFRKERRIFEHGVSFAECLKLPAILYAYTGDRKWLALGHKGVEDAWRENGQPSGQISANEFLSGRGPRQAYETCVTADMLWSLGYYVEADGSVRDADRMEALAYNALPGAIKKDFTGHQYLSSVNQVACTPWSNDTHFNYGEAPWRQYRTSHFPQCCSGNVNRAMPNFAFRMWLRDSATGGPCAMLHGPSELSADYHGKPFRFVAETEYPFDETIRYSFHAEKPVEMPLFLRIPGWARRARLTLNGKPLAIIAKAGTIVRVERRWTDGDTLELLLPAEVELRGDRYWHWFERGPLVYSYAVPSSVTPEFPGDRFSPVSIEPTGPWNYAVDLAALRRRKPVFERRESAYPFETPSSVLRVPVGEIREWQTLDEQRFTPPVPMFTHPTGAKREIELVPFATTLARVTAFPDLEKREPLFVVAAYASDAYDYDPKKPLRKQKAEPETKPWTDLDFRHRPLVQRTPQCFFDLGGHFGANKNKFAYLMFRFWSDKAGLATYSLAASNAVQAFIGGKEVFLHDGIFEGEMMEPEWFRHRVKKGYNYLLLKLATPGKQGQYRREWGAKLEVFL